MTIVGIDHVQLTAPPGSEPEARRFYRGLLGLPEIVKPESMQDTGGVWFEAGLQQIHIGIEDPFVPARKAHPGLRVEVRKLDVLAARLEDAGATVHWDERHPGVRRFFTADPFGNRLEFLAS
jgi:catechol 2,3-dioxygenase-like lactoylglutathione lyase family enzyme